MSSAKLSFTNVAAEPEEEGDGFGGNSISVEVSRSGIEPFYRFLDSNSDSEPASSMDTGPEFIDFFRRDYDIGTLCELRLSSNQRLRTSGGLDIWEEGRELRLGIGSGSGDGDSGGVVVDREIDVEVGTGIDLNGDEAMEIEYYPFDNVINPIDVVEEPIQVNPPRVNDWRSFVDDDIRFFEDMLDMDTGLVLPTVYEDGDIDGMYEVVLDDGMYEAVLAQTFDSQDGVMGSPPASKSVVDNLPAVVITSEELRNGDIVCAICKDEIAVAKRLPCKHYYHEECIVPWLGIRNTCPVCRYDLPTDDLEYETNKRLQRRG